MKKTIDLLVAAATATENGKAKKDNAYKNIALFRSCISKINSTLIDDVEDLDKLMPMYI